MKENHPERARAHARPKAAIVFTVLILLAACGQKGPLVLPGHAKDTPWPLPPNKPATGPNTPPGNAKSGDGAGAPASTAPASAAPAGTGTANSAPAGNAVGDPAPGRQ